MTLNPTRLPAGQLSPKLRAHTVEQCIANANRTLYGHCIWPECRRPRAALMQSAYRGAGDPPLCVQHVEQTWRIAQAVADERNYRTDPAPREIPPRPTSKVGWIYYLAVGDHIKIGYASNVGRRLRSYPPTATLIFAHRGTRDDEKNIHSRLHPYCAAGREWYERHPRVLALIDAAQAKHQNEQHLTAEPESKPAPRPRGRTASQYVHRV